MTAQTSDRDFLERLDAAIGCQHCGKNLPESAVSDYFCGQQCSEAYSAQRAPHTRSYDYFSDVDDDGHAWTPDDLTDLEPVSWIRPPEFRLPRSTGDLEADQRALEHACDMVSNAAQQAACDLRQDDLDARRRVIWAREWRLPRSTGNYRADMNAAHEAERTATTAAQRAACALRREDLNARRRAMSPPPFPGRQPSWSFDRHTFSPLRDLPIISTEQAQRAAERILAACSPSDPDYYDATPFGRNLPGIQRSTFEICGFRAPDLLTYELRRDSDDTLMAMYTVPEGQQFSMELPYYLDAAGCSWRIINSRGEVIQRLPVTSRNLWTTPDPPPLAAVGDTISISTGDGTHRYTVESVGPGTSMTCRRVREDPT